MSFGVIFASLCCCMILIASIRNIIHTVGKKPELNEYVIYAIAPAGVAIGIFYYIFFVREVDVVQLFTGYTSINVWLDLVISFVLPTIILSALFVSYHLIKNAILHFIIITSQCFILMAWALIIWNTVYLSQDFGPAQNPEFPNTLWSISVIVTFLIVALFERHQKHKLKE